MIIAPTTVEIKEIERSNKLIKSYSLSISYQISLDSCSQTLSSVARFTEVDQLTFATKWASNFLDQKYYFLH